MTRPTQRAALTASVLALPSAGMALPDGPGRDAVEGVCTACHATTLIERSAGYTRAHWDALIATMVDLSGDPETRMAVLDYLAQAFPPGDTRAATPR